MMTPTKACELLTRAVETVASIGLPVYAIEVQDRAPYPHTRPEAVLYYTAIDAVPLAAALRTFGGWSAEYVDRNHGVIEATRGDVRIIVAAVEGGGDALAAAFGAEVPQLMEPLRTGPVPL